MKNQLKDHITNSNERVSEEALLDPEQGGRGNHAPDPFFLESHQDNRHKSEKNGRIVTQSFFNICAGRHLNLNRLLAEHYDGHSPRTQSIQK